MDRQHLMPDFLAGFRCCRFTPLTMQRHQFLGPGHVDVFAGDTLRAVGQVSEILDGGTVVLQQQLMKGDDIVAEATTSVLLPE